MRFRGGVGVAVPILGEGQETANILTLGGGIIKQITNRVSARFSVMVLALSVFVASAFATPTPPDYSGWVTDFKDGLGANLNEIMPAVIGLMVLIGGIAFVLRFVKRGARVS